MYKCIGTPGWVVGNAMQFPSAPGVVTATSGVVALTGKVDGDSAKK